MNKKVKYVTVLFLLFWVVIYAEVPVPTPFNDPPGLPIDVFSSILLIFGALYGAFKIKNK